MNIIIEIKEERNEVAANISTSAASIEKVLKSIIFQEIKITY